MLTLFLLSSLSASQSVVHFPHQAAATFRLSLRLLLAAVGSALELFLQEIHDMCGGRNR